MRVRCLQLLWLGMITVYRLPAQMPPGQKLSMALYAISEMYVDRVNADSLAEGQLRELIARLDPHSEYLPARSAEASESYLLGTAAPTAGIGTELTVLDDTCRISFLVPGGPAQQAGLLPGDPIVAADGEPVTGENLSRIFQCINGPVNSPVQITVLRENQPTIFPVIRENRPASSVTAAYMIDDRIGYLALTGFTQSTVADFNEKMRALKRQGVQSLILDLSNNGGGFFESALELADEFLDGDKLLVRAVGQQIGSVENYAQFEGIFESGPLAVLVSEKTSSAAEIFAGAIQDWDRGIIVGRRTFGKGLIQETLPFPDGSALRLTVARYFTPSGRSIQKPYTRGEPQEYYREVANRPRNDSIPMVRPEEPPFRTMLHYRPLTDDGGIVPDVFVPADRALSTDWYRMLVLADVQKIVAARYVLRHREELQKKYPDFGSFSEKFAEPRLAELLREEAQRAGIPCEPSQYEQSAPWVEIQLQALTARELFGDNEYYFRVIDRHNASLQAALEILRTPARYEEILGGH